MSSKLPPVRRIVTGHDSQGKSITTLDGPPPTIRDKFPQKGLVFYELWNTQKAPVQVSRGGDPTVGKSAVVHPPKGGTILRIVDIPPEEDPDNALTSASADNIFSSVGLTAAKSAHSQGRHPLMHRTETIDYGIVLAGEVTLVLDDSELLVSTGDIVVQCGTIHAWANRSKTTCRMAFVLIDGKYEEGLGVQIGAV
jgi:hypothetical protein